MMKMIRIVFLVNAITILCILQTIAQINPNILQIKGTRFFLNDVDFEYTGVSFFNAIYNEEFNKDSSTRKLWMQKFHDSGINVLRIWCQWDIPRGYADADSENTIYNADGSIKPEQLQRIKEIIEDANEKDMVILLVFFSRGSWRENLRLSDKASEIGVSILTTELKQFGNVVFQIWNEFNYRTIDYFKIIKSIDPDRLVTNSPGYAGDLGTPEENRVLDFLSPHTSRATHRHWEIAPKQIAYLISTYRKPVVDDEPARKGTPKYGGPKAPTLPIDHILHIYNVWKSGGYVIYHHDMFQTGYGSEAVPLSGIPAPGFSQYHDEIFNFLKIKERILKNIRNSNY